MRVTKSHSIYTLRMLYSIFTNITCSKFQHICISDICNSSILYIMCIGNRNNKK